MKNNLKIFAKKLRQNGHSFREISERLAISKSTASSWTRNETMSAQGKIRFKNLITFSYLKAQSVLVSKQEEHLKNLAKNCQALKNTKKYAKDELKIFLALLYWCEGSKTERTMTFVNSDSEMIKVYLNLLRNSFDIKEEKLSAWLHLHSYHNQSEMVNFWSKLTAIDKNKIHIYNKANSGLRKKENYKGCISIRYGDYRIFDEVMLIIKRFVGLKI